MVALNDFRKDLSELKFEFASVVAEWKFRKFMRAMIKAGFNPDQPRDGHGRWTDGSSTDFSAQRRGVVVDYSGALTGISTIDEITSALSETLAQTMKVMDFIPDWTPQLYGTAVHAAFGTEVRFAGFRGIGFADVEHSFIDGEDADYGQQGSIRTDVLLRNEVGDIIAIYDVKTGQSGLSAQRVRELREHTGVSSSVPIIELNVTRGARIKSAYEVEIGKVIARLWRPADHSDNEDPAEAG